MRRRPRIKPRKKSESPNLTYFEEQFRAALCDINIEDEVQKSEGFLVSDSVVMYKKARELLQKNAKCSSTGQINWVILGQKYKIQALYRSFYPLQIGLLEEIHVCDGCFQYFMSPSSCVRHMARCAYRFKPPGTEIYHDRYNNIKIFEVSGKHAKEYCCNLSMMTVVWIRDKVVCFDVDEFIFYILTREVEGSCEILGYFSRCSQSFDENLSCFCVFPCFQRMGLGRFLIDFSYLITRMMRMTGGPEKPLSPLGRMAYKTYWFETIAVVAYTIMKEGRIVTPYEISRETGIRAQDVVETLQEAFFYEHNSTNNTAVCHVYDGKELAETVASIKLTKKYFHAEEKFLKAEFKNRLLKEFCL
ncbi:unnamed protein product [Auanema sp. JU1783]|nr:unnamed protein product [Auanema sp. JU1783]